jgi:hypothetical protein
MVLQQPAKLPSLIRRVGSIPTPSAIRKEFIMNIKTAATLMWAPVALSNLPDEHPEHGKDHLRYMLSELVEGKITGEKAHRWLGWVQGCVCVGGGTTLEEMRRINKAA